MLITDFAAGKHSALARSFGEDEEEEEGSERLVVSSCLTTEQRRRSIEFGLRQQAKAIPRREWARFRQAKFRQDSTCMTAASLVRPLDRFEANATSSQRRRRRQQPAPLFASPN